MIDLHTHILPGVDDGSKTIEQSLFMVKQGEKAEITTIRTTAHILHQVTPQLEEKINHSLHFLKTTVIQEEVATSSSPFSSLKYYLALGPDNGISMKVNVWGEVANPGSQYVPDQIDLIGLLSAAGGPLESAKHKKIEI